MSDCDFITAQAEYHAALEEQMAIAEKVHDAKVKMLALDRRKRTMFDETRATLLEPSEREE